MTRNLLVAGAAAVIAVAIGVALLLGRGSSPIVGTASPSPSPSQGSVQTPSAKPSQADLGGPLPAQLQARWMGKSAVVSGLSIDAGTSVVFSANGVGLSPSNANTSPVLSASATSTGQVLRLTSGSACNADDIGLYGWSISSDGRTLTLTGQSDACATRLAALAGTWWLDGCKDTQTNCLGDLGPGTYASQYIAPRVKPGTLWSPVFGGLTYTVPAGWANSSDWPNTFGLTPSTDYATVGPGGQEGGRSILLITQPAALSPMSACSGAVDNRVAHTVSAEVSSIEHTPGLISSAPTAISIGGHQGQWVDVRLNPTWKTACPGGPGPEADFLASPGSNSPPILGVVGTAMRQRVIVLDLGSGDLLAIDVSTDATAPFNAFVARQCP